MRIIKVIRTFFTGVLLVVAAPLSVQAAYYFETYYYPFYSPTHYYYGASPTNYYYGTPTITYPYTSNVVVYPTTTTTSSYWWYGGTPYYYNYNYGNRTCYMSGNTLVCG